LTWDRSHTLALAHHNCVICCGLGLRGSAPCLCVTREIFRLCFRRFRELRLSTAISRATLDRNARTNHSPGWGRKNEEYSADFLLLARRTLSSARYEIFRLHFLLAVDIDSCCRRLKMERYDFLHQVYRIQSALGRAAVELEPYALFPVDEYFSGSRLVECVGHAPSTPARSRAAVRRLPTPARPPLAFPEALAA
jgi:hypothetical protein